MRTPWKFPDRCDVKEFQEVIKVQRQMIQKLSIEPRSKGPVKPDLEQTHTAVARYEVANLKLTSLRAFQQTVHRKSRRRRQFEDASFQQKDDTYPTPSQFKLAAPVHDKKYKKILKAKGQRQSRERSFGRRREEHFGNREPFWSESLLYQKKILTSAERIVVNFLDVELDTYREPSITQWRM